MKDLLEQLESNSAALDSLQERLYNVKSSSFYTYFKTEYERQIEMNWVFKLQKRVLRMRYRILENINSETVKMMQEISNQQSKLIINNAAA